MAVAVDSGAQPPCRASLRVEPATPFVEQAVAWQLEIASRDDLDRVEWLEAPAFPGARAERVTILPDARDDAGWRIRRDERVLFPERAGPLLLPAARLACGSADRWHEVRIPSHNLEVRPLPAAGRPAGFEGLVGPVTLRRYLRPERLTLGGSARITVSLRGPGNVWAASDPLRELTVAGAELFPRKAQGGIERGGGLRVTRVFEVDVVPRHTGVLRLPPLRVDWFDPETGRYRSESVPGGDVPVAERSTANDPPAPESVGSSESRQAPGSGALRETLPAAWLWVGARALLVLGLLAGIAWRLRARRAAEGGHTAPKGGSDDPAARAERELRAALAAARPDAFRLGPEELLARDDLGPNERAVAELLRRAERARFDRAVAPPPPDEVAAGIEALRRETRR